MLNSPRFSSVFNSGSYEIEIACERYPARASLCPLYDPKSEWVRG